MSQYDCQVQLPDSAGNPERVLTVIGDQENCIGVFEECLDKVKNEIKRRDMHAPIEVQVLIPQPFMGTIIGTGGMKIKDLRKRTNCNIKIFSDPMPYSNERSISLSGNEEEIINCVTFFLQEIGQREPKEPIILYDPSVPPDMPPPFDYPPQHGYRRGGRGRGRGGGGGGGGRMYDGRGSGGGRGGHNYRHQHHGPPSHQSGPPSGLLPTSEGVPPPSIGAQDTNNNMPLPPPGAPAVQQPPLVGQPQQVRSNQSGQQVTSLFTQQGQPPSSVQYPTPGSSSNQPPSATSGPSPYPPQTHPPSSGPQGYAPPNNTQGSYSPGQQPQPLTTGVAPSPLVNPSSQPPSTQYPQSSTVTPQSSYPVPNQQPQYTGQQDGYSNQTGYGNSQAPTSYTQSSYVPTQPTGVYSASNYQQPHPSYPPPPVPPTQTQPYYGGSGQYQTPPNPVFPAANTMHTGYDQQTKQVTIPHEFTNAILGPGGSKLLQIRTQSRCNITMDDVKPNSSDRVITIVGSSMDITMAEQLMKDSVRQHHKV